MEYLGHIISSDGIRHQSSKIQAIVEMPDPQNKKELRSFLGIANITIDFHLDWQPNVLSSMS